MRLLVTLVPDFDEPCHLGHPMIQHVLCVPCLLEDPPIKLIVGLPCGAYPHGKVHQPHHNRGNRDRDHGCKEALRIFAGAQVSHQEVDHVGCDQREQAQYRVEALQKMSLRGVNHGRISSKGQDLA